MYKLISILLFTVMSLNSNGSSITDVANNSYKVTGNSMVKGQWTGSAFSIGNYIVTNRHVANNADMIKLTDVRGITHKTKVLNISTQYDLALLEIVNKNVKGVDLCLDSNLPILSPIYNIGNPGSEDFILTTGYISGSKRLKPFFKTDSYFLVHNLVGTRGQSGSAIIDVKRDCVAGVVTGGAPSTYIGFSIPVETLVKYVTNYEKSLIKENK